MARVHYKYQRPTRVIGHQRQWSLLTSQLLTSHHTAARPRYPAKNWAARSIYSMRRLPVRRYGVARTGGSLISTSTLLFTGSTRRSSTGTPIMYEIDQSAYYIVFSLFTFLPIARRLRLLRLLCGARWDNSPCLRRKLSVFYSVATTDISETKKHNRK